MPVLTTDYVQKHEEILVVNVWAFVELVFTFPFRVTLSMHRDLEIFCTLHYDLYVRWFDALPVDFKYHPTYSWGVNCLGSIGNQVERHDIIWITNTKMRNKYLIKKLQMENFLWPYYIVIVMFRIGIVAACWQSQLLFRSEKK